MASSDVNAALQQGESHSRRMPRWQHAQQPFARLTGRSGGRWHCQDEEEQQHLQRPHQAWLQSAHFQRLARPLDVRAPADEGECRVRNRWAPAQAPGEPGANLQGLSLNGLLHYMAKAWIGALITLRRPPTAAQQAQQARRVSSFLLHGVKPARVPHVKVMQASSMASGGQRLGRARWQLRNVKPARIYVPLIAFAGSAK